MRYILCTLALSLLLVVSNSTTVNQTKAKGASCPNGRTAFIVINGILVPDKKDWEGRVQRIGEKFFATTGLAPTCIQFQAVHNQSGWIIQDLEQSIGQLRDQALLRINFSDPDFVTLLTRIGEYSTAGYKVVLVGHSQGSLYTNLSYNAIARGDARNLVPAITTLPNPSRLSIVNIATPSWYVADSVLTTGRYTTQCGDVLLQPLLGLIGRLPANVNSTFANYYCLGYVVSQGGPYVPSWQIHSLEESYLLAGSESQRKIYQDLVESLSTIVLPIPPPPTLTATCSVNPAAITAGQSATFTGSATGGTGIRRGSWSGVVSGNASTAVYRTSISTPSGFGKATYTVTDSGNPKQVAVANCQVQVKALVQKGTIVITTGGTVPSVNCKINSTSVTGPGTFTNQSTGSKTLSCTPPSGFTLTSITPSETQTLVAGGTISFKVSLASAPQTPVLTRISVNTNPKVNTRVSVTLGGTGLNPPGVQAYFCTSSSTSSCKAVTSIHLYESDSVTFSFTPTTLGTMYLRVKKNGKWSNYKTMVVIR